MNRTPADATRIITSLLNKAGWYPGGLTGEEEDTPSGSLRQARKNQPGSEGRDFRVRHPEGESDDE